jgi:hypothetical protein
MTSFIELPRLAFDGRDLPSVYVNTADIVMLEELHDGQARVEIRDLGTEGMTATIKTYAPLAVLLGELSVLAQTPTVSSWSTDSKTAWAAPIAHTLRAAADRERAAAR